MIADGLEHGDLVGLGLYEQAQACWRVDDLSAEVADLRSRGVEIPDFPQENTVDGVADVGFALTASFVDPHRNSIALIQFKG